MRQLFQYSPTQKTVSYTHLPRYSGLPTVLKENGYYNLFFMTHEGQYDNMNAFFRTNGYDEVFSQENYPADKVVNRDVYKRQDY